MQQGGYQQQPAPYGQPPQQQQQYVQPPPQKPMYQQQQYASPNQSPTQGAPLISGGPQMGTPIYGDDPNCAPILKQKFVSQGYKDVWAAVIFVLQIIIMIGVAGYNAQAGKIKFDFAVSDNKDSRKAESYIAAAFAMAFVFCMLALAAMRAAPTGYIWGANILSIVLWVALGLYTFAETESTSSLFILIFAVIQGIYLFFIRKRIPFAGVLLKHSVTTVTKNWGTFVMSFLQVFFLVLYVIAWICMVVPSLNDLAGDSTNCSSSGSSNTASGSGSTDTYCTSTGVSGGVYALCLVFLLMWYWSVQVMTNVVHVTASGTVATWYFAGDAQMPPQPSVASAKRAMTTSFGSICFGSLLVAILKLIHTMLRSAARRGGFAACIAACIMGCIERLMEYFNVYAFTHVAIYGMSYIEAGKATWEMIKNCGWSALFNDNLVYPVLTMTSLVSSIAIGVILGLASKSVLLGLICFLVAYVVHILLLRIVYSGIVTIFVCTAEAEDVLAVTNPAFHHEIQQAKLVMQESTC